VSVNGGGGLGGRVASFSSHAAISTATITADDRVRLQVIVRRTLLGRVRDWRSTQRVTSYRLTISHSRQVIIPAAIKTITGIPRFTDARFKNFRYNERPPPE
jgi:hypothetical protein